MEKNIYLLLILMGVTVPLLSCLPKRQSNTLHTEKLQNFPDSYSISQQGWEYQDKQGPEYQDKWWKTFNSEELNILIEKALTNNFSIIEAWCRLRQVRAQAVKAGAGLYPDISVNVEASKSRQRSENPVTQKLSTSAGENYALGLAGSYELDFWGKIHSEKQAARLESMATRQDINTAAMSIAAQTTEHWINIISQKAKKDLLQEQLNTNLIFLDLVKLRFRKSLVSALDVLQQQQAVEKVKAVIPLIEAREQTLLHELALLLGRAPGTIEDMVTTKLSKINKVPRIGLPADLLTKRPDVQAAYLRLQVSDRQLATAKANQFPAIRLSARALYSATELANIFDTWLLNLAGSLTAPVFNRQRLKAEVDRSKAVTDQKLITYRRTLLTAIKEVENALIQEEKHCRHINALQSQISLAEQALEKARQRYLKGLIDYLPVLTELLKAQNLQNDLIQRRTELLIYRVNLHRALGGTWMNNPEEGNNEQ